MITINSISGGQTSCYIAAKYPANYNIFALVRIEDISCKFPDEKIRQLIEDRIQQPFIATPEDNTIIYTILDLEQFIGNKINIVTGETFEKVIKNAGNYLPNKVKRFCTSELKIKPMFYWWAKHIKQPVEMRIGFRANEQGRKITMIEKCDQNGLLQYKATFTKNDNGQNKWENVSWQKPVFPLIDIKPTWKDQIIEFWKDKPIRFSKRNNCIGCFHRNPMLLKQQQLIHPEKFEWFNNQEKISNGTWRSDVSYNEIIKYNPQIDLFNDDFNDCDSGYCTY